LDEKEFKSKGITRSPETSSLNSSFFLNEKNLEKFIYNSKNNIEFEETAESVIKYNENLKKNKNFSEILEDKSIFLKNIYISNSYEFDFYQNFYFFLTKQSCKFKNKNFSFKNLNKIFFFKSFFINFFVDFSLKNILFFKKKKIQYTLKFYFFKKIFIFILFSFFLNIVKNHSKINLFKSKFSLNKLCNSFFFFNKSFIFLNSSIFHSILNVFSNSFFFFLYKFFIKFKFKKKDYGSTTPFYLFSNSLKKKIFFNVESKISNQFLYLNKFFLFFFENFFKSKIFFKIKFFKKIYNFIEKKLKNYNFYSKFNWAQLKIGKGFFLKEMLKIFWISFFIKDPKFLLNWISKTMNRIYFKNHKKFLIVFKAVASRFFYFFFKDLNFKGFFFDIRGKVGVTGNAKKRHFSIKLGRFSHSRKSLRLNMFQNLVKTKTGVLGLTLVISF
jgi:hypothetical protein